MENSDPLANAAGIIAIVVAGNQPFYPLYLHAIVGAAAWPAWLTLLIDAVLLDGSGRCSDVIHLADERFFRLQVSRTQCCA